MFDIKMNKDKEVNNKEARAIDELRKRMESNMEPEMYEDINLFYRFLKARDFNVNNAEDMLRKHLLWRKKIDLENFVLPEVFEKYYPYNFLGYDKEGCVLRYVPVGTSDIVGIFRNITLEDVERCIAYAIEEDLSILKEQSKNLKTNLEKYSAIYDLQHLTFRQIIDKNVVQAAIALARALEKNYPERLKTLYVINGSAYIAIIYNILKPILGAEILKKIHIYSDDSWKNDILNKVDADVLPAVLGGTRTDPDGNPHCLTFLNYGGKVPEKYYMHKSKRLSSEMEGVKKITISNACFHKDMFEVKHLGSYIEWEFETKRGDIGFGLFYEAMYDNEKPMELIPLLRIDTKHHSQSGRYCCDKIGKYVFLFDNSYSWIRNKELYYRINIVSPEDADYK